MSILLLSTFLGFFPDRENVLTANRTKLGESLSVQLSLLVSKGEMYLAGEIAKRFLQHNDNANGILIHNNSGVVFLKAGKIDMLNENLEGETSIVTHIKVPVFNGERIWGKIHINYAPLYAQGWRGKLDWFKTSIYGLALLISTVGFLGYLTIISRALVQLDPQNVIPARVKLAFNTLTEGVVIIDNRERILLANNTFSAMVNRDAESLTGISITHFDWNLRKGDSTSTPWKATLSDGGSVTGAAIYLAASSGDSYSLSVNSSPIEDNKKNVRGALITFEDVSELEKHNAQMNKLVVRLIETEKEVSEKNISLKQLANYDALTNCLNRRALLEQFENYYQDHLQQDKSLACLMFDIDFFKRVNDTFGHTVGDHAIQFIAKVLHGKSREGDLVARYGGEEFVVVLPNTSTKEANEFAERVRKTVQGESTVSFTEAGPITVSIGVSTLNSKPAGLEQFIDFADQALYVAKNSGRNQAVCWESINSLKADPELNLQ
jgi:diguanylate cyclase (GGDEF)-like protein/PAS domain S-box-containing protein